MMMSELGDCLLIVIWWNVDWEISVFFEFEESDWESYFLVFEDCDVELV